MNKIISFLNFNKTRSKTMKKIQLEDAWAFEKQLLIATGFYPKEQKSLLYWLKFLLTMFFSVGQLSAMFIQVSLESDLSKIVDTLYFCMTETAYVCKLFNFAFRRKKFIAIEKFATDPSFNRYTKEQQYILNESIGRCVKIARFYRGLCLVVITLMSVYPIVDQNNKKLLPLTGWYPLDRDRYYVVIYLFQTIALWLSAAMNSCFDTLASACICVGAIQLDILMKNFEIVLQNNEENVENAENVEIHNTITKNIQHHTDVSNYINLVEFSFSNGIFVQFLASIVVICMTGFQMLVVSPTSVQFLSLFSYFSCMMFQVALYCWYGHDVLVKSSNIGNSCYMSDWYKYDLIDQKSLFIIMEQTKRPLRLTAGKFFTLSLQTLTMILRSSYSYFAVLRHVYSENEGVRRIKTQ